MHFMIQSTLHIAIIMDGNGRWAQTRGLPRTAGHRAGADAVRRVVEAAPELGVGVLTLYAFSSDNWRRPAAEVETLMRLLRSYLRSEVEKLRENGVRLSFIGRRDRLSPVLVSMIDAAEAATRPGRKLHLRIALDYSSRDAIVDAARAAAASGEFTREAFARQLDSPDVDLLIRTSGEKRVSDYLLWEIAYSEFHFTSCHWPDFDKQQLAEAVREFHARERRYGGLPAAV
jgi:undecaprenyl diphosphate synthase